MKKLFIIVSIVFSIFLVSDEVFALEYEVNGNTYTVNTDEKLIDYCYFTYVKSNSSVKVFSVEKTGGGSYYCYVDTRDLIIHYHASSNFWVFEKTNSGSIVDINYYSFRSDYSFVGQGSFNKNYTQYPNILFSNVNWYSRWTNGAYPIYYSSDDLQDIEDKYNIPPEPTYYTITYYLNNEVYREIEVEEGTSHTLLYYEPNSDYNFSGWDYGNANLSNIQSDITITGTTTLKPYYTISYYLNSELYNSVSVIEGTNYSLVDYVPPKNYQFSGWTYDSNIDLSNIQSNVNIFGTSVYVRPQMTYNEESNSTGTSLPNIL